MKDVAPIVIIGSGMAGYTLARELRKLNEQLPIHIICRDNGDNYSKPTLSNAFAQNKNPDNIALSNANGMADNLHINIYPQSNVIAIDKNQQVITLKNQQTEQITQQKYAKLVIATGANPKTIANIETDQQRIFAVNHLDNYQQFRQAIDQLKTDNNPLKIAIIGAGLIGCEFANDLLSQNIDQQTFDITIFDKAERPIQQLLPNQASELLQQSLEKLGVNFYLGVDIGEINKHEQGITLNIKHKENNQQYQVDIVLLAVGLVANTQLAELAEISIANTDIKSQQNLPKSVPQGILVNEFLQTSDPNIYAIGDCANVLGSFLPYVMPLMNQAKALAKTLSDSEQAPTAVHYPAMPVAIKTPACPLVVLPIPERHLLTSVWQQQPTEDGIILIAYDNQQIVGFALVGKEASKQRMTLVKQIPDWLTCQSN